MTRTLACLAGWLLVTGCGDAGRRVLILYSPHGRDLLAAFEQRFETGHPGVDVQYVDMGSQEVLDRVRSERANPQADVWWGAPSDMFAQAADLALLEAFRPSWADALAEDARDPQDRWTATFLTPEVIAYNEDAVPADQVPRDWDAVLEPRWRGHILIRDPLASGTMRTIFGAIMYREYRRTGNPEAGYEWLLRLDAQTKEYVLNPTLLYQKLARREGLITLWDMPDIETLRSATELPINYVLPESGTPMVVDAIAVVRGTPNPELAREFVEFAGSPESVLFAARAFFRIPARPDMALDSLPDWLREATPKIKPMELDQGFIRQRIGDWLRYWDQNIRGRGAALAH
ncbi:MAG: extracellular solute-binding protein [Gemmatimonadetes bacterium]|nr:extracellular solute-binding protein [Gemmatimonadota bacterium]